METAWEKAEDCAICYKKQEEANEAEWTHQYREIFLTLPVVRKIFVRREANPRAPVFIGFGTLAFLDFSLTFRPTSQLVFRFQEVLTRSDRNHEVRMAVCDIR